MAADTRDPALETLFLPFEQGLLKWPAEGGALFLRARDGWPLRQQSRPGLICEQSFKPDAEALAQSGWTVADPGDAASDVRHALVMVLPPRQRDEARALFAQALQRCAPGGVVVACIANDDGAKSGEGDFRKLCGLDGNLTKHHCRVFWVKRDDAKIDAALLAQWSTLDAVRPILGGRFVSRPGVFAWDRIDPASALLVKHLPTDLAGCAADLGAGFGYLSVELLTRCPRILHLDLYEAEQRALDLAKTNLASLESRATLEYHWHDVTTGLPHKYDVIVTNPPFHTQSSADRPDIGRRFITSAAAALNPGGRLWLVANRHLPYEAVLNDSFGKVRIVAQQDGFKIVEAIKSSAKPSAAKYSKTRDSSPRMRR